MKQFKFSFNKLFWGVLFLAGAALLLANRLGYWPSMKNVNVVAVFLTIFFVWMAIQGIYQRNFFLILFGLSLIAIQFDEFLGITAITPWTLLSAALLASIGLSIIFPTRKVPAHGNKVDSSPAGRWGKVIEEQDGEMIYFMSRFGTCVKYINSDELVNVQLENSFGQMKIFFDNATIKNGVADVDVRNSFGEMILYIPKTWVVEDDVKNTFGPLKFEGIQNTEGSPVLRIHGSVSFGEITVVYI